MSEDRPVEEPVDRVAQLERDLHDLRTTMAAQVSRRPVGDVEPTIRKVAKAGTLLLQGQTVNRADQPVLWQWVQDQGLIVPGLFGAGNNTTTFVLPDFRGRVPYGANTTHPLGALFGVESLVLSLANMPRHSHDDATGWGGEHSHGSETGYGGADHGGHNDRSFSVRAGENTPPHYVIHTSTGYVGRSATHWHGIPDQGAHKHGIPPSGSTNPTPIDNNAPSISVNWLIWT